MSDKSRVISALLHICEKKLSIRAVLVVLPEVILAEFKAENYKAVMYEQLRCIAKNTAMAVPGGEYINKDYRSMFGRPDADDERSGDEIALGILGRLAEE